MSVRRTTIEIDEDLLRAAQSRTGDGLRATVEAALRLLVEQDDAARVQRRQRVAAHLKSAGKMIDPDVLLSDEAWR